jgi:pyrimidine-nucleoside phosphorylase
MRAVDVIARKRDGGELSADEISWFVRGLDDGAVTDYQAAAWLMAVYLRGLRPRTVGGASGRQAQHRRRWRQD